MKNIKSILRIIPVLVFTSLAASTRAQTVSIPDPGLNAAIRAALQKPTGLLTQQDLLNLTNLDASSRNVNSIQGLDAARNLLVLNLFNNNLTNFTLSSGISNLTLLDLGINSLTQCSLPGGLTNLNTLFIEGNQLANLTLPAGLIALTNLDLSGNGLTNLIWPADMTNMVSALIFANRLTNLTLPSGLRHLNSLDLDFNQFPTLNFPAGLTNLSRLEVRGSQLANLVFPADTKNLSFLDLSDNQLSNLALPAGISNLTEIFLEKNQLTNFVLPAGLTNLIQIDLSENELTSFQLPAGLVNLSSLALAANQLTNFLLPAGLTSLNQLDVSGNGLTSFQLPAGIVNLTSLDLTGNQLTNFTLPSDVTKLMTLALDFNPLAFVVLPDPLAATNLSATVNALRNQGISVFTFPPLAQLTSEGVVGGKTFQFTLFGPPGIYTVLASADLITWSNVGSLTNQLGAARFSDPSPLLSQKFYRTALQGTPTNMVFIPPNTFALGSPSNEVDRSADEGPQTTVTLSHGFWISKFLVTQRDYINVIGSNPSDFTGDLSRPVERVSWLDATNYCAQLTQQDLAAGRIPPGSHYRLPTEAEWECAARAGTSTRFYYGDDPGATLLSSHAWYGVINGAITHPVGQKPPNAWGLFDMEGNVWEWCLDWYGPYPGGAETDPQGPASNPTGVKVIRGGAWDAFDSDCRSARRLTEGVSPFITDDILGFRVVLVTEP